MVIIKRSKCNPQSEYLKMRRRSLRMNITKGELALWRLLRNRELSDYKFRRQISIGGCIVDFYCHKLKLIIEVDGGIHNDQTEHDARREAWLKQQGYNIIRVMNEDSIYNAETILKVIKDKMVQLTKSR